MGKHLVIVGGGHAHLTVLLRCREYIEQGHRVTLVNPSPYHYYSGMGPGMLAGTYRPQDIRFHVRKTAEDRGATFVEDAVLRVEAAARLLHLRSGKTLGYDVVSFNTGSVVQLPARVEGSENVFIVKPIVSLQKAQKAVLKVISRKTAKIVVIGGGPAGVEMAGNVWRLVHDHHGQAHITLVAGGRILGEYPEQVRRMARNSLARRGIVVREAAYAEAIGRNEVELADGERLPTDITLVATGVTPSSIFKDSGLPIGPDNGLLVDRFLRSTAYPEIFGGGDCVSFAPRPLAKVGVYAVRENMILHRNIFAALNHGTMTPFEPQRKFLLIFNMGDNRAILIRNNFAWDGRPAWWIKDRIDRGFMRKFQVSGEREEP